MTNRTRSRPITASACHSPPRRCSLEPCTRQKATVSIVSLETGRGEPAEQTRRYQAVGGAKWPPQAWRGYPSSGDPGPEDREERASCISATALSRPSTAMATYDTFCTAG